MNRRSVSNHWLLGGFLFSLAANPLPAATSPETTLSQRVASSIRSVAREKSGSLVRVRCRDQRGEVNGTGFQIDPTGTICTLAELVLPGGEITVSQGPGECPATPIAIDPRSGVAFLKVGASGDGAMTPEGALFLPPTSLTNTPQFTPVVGMGLPRGEQAALSLGMITGTQAHEKNRYFCVPHLTAAIALSEGEAGSPVLDLSGNLVGMVMGGGSAACLILPSGAIEKLHHDILRYGRINPGWVGAVVEEAAVPEGNSRARVVSIEPGSPAETAGLRVGDMIVSLSGKAIREPEEILGASFYLRGGEKVRMNFVRGGESRTIDFRCAELPDAMAAAGGSSSETPLVQH